MDHLISIVQAQLAGLDNPLTESDLISLGLSLGPALLLDALDLVDRHQVSSLSPPSGRLVMLVNSSTTATKYHVHLSAFSPKLLLGYCPCPTLALKLFTPGSSHPSQPTSVPICKHLLAAVLATHLGQADRKQVTLNWLASWATNFSDQQG